MRVIVALLSAVVVSSSGTPPTKPTGTLAFVRFDERVGHPRINVVAVHGGIARPLRLRVTAADEPSWSRNGHSLVFVGGRNAGSAPHVTLGDDLYVVRRDGSHLRRLTRDKAHESGPVWSPDGTSIAYARSAAATPNRSSIYTLSATGTNVRRLTRGSFDLQPSWSSDGHWIAFLRIDPTTHTTGVWKVKPNGKGLQRILTSLANVTEPSFSPEGERLLVTDGKRLLVVATNGVTTKTIANLGSDARGDRIDPQPAWSPDARFVAFVQMRAGSDGRADIWIVGAQGNGLRRLTRSPGMDFAPTWRS